MVNGRFQCFGSLQHLKSKFGRGISLIVRLKQQDRVQGLRGYMNEHFPQHTIKDEHLGQISFELPATYGWPYIFAKLEDARNAFEIDDYSVSQVSLEQVFLDMTKHQQEAASS